MVLNFGFLHTFLLICQQITVMRMRMMKYELILSSFQHNEDELILSSLPHDDLIPSSL